MSSLKKKIHYFSFFLPTFVKTSFLACFGLLSPPHGWPHPINRSNYFGHISSDQLAKKMSFILRSSTKLRFFVVGGQLAHFWPFCPPLRGWCNSWRPPGGHLRVPTSHHTSTPSRKLRPVQSEILVDFWGASLSDCELIFKLRSLNSWIYITKMNKISI